MCTVESEASMDFCIAYLSNGRQLRTYIFCLWCKCKSYGETTYPGECLKTTAAIELGRVHLDAARLLGASGFTSDTRRNTIDH
jgi:hypothetical protein